MKTEKSYRNMRRDIERHQLPNRLLTLREVSTMLRVSMNTVRSWSDLGLIRSYRLGPRGDRRYVAKDINSFVATIRPSSERAVLVIANSVGIRQLIKDTVAEQGIKAIAVESAERALTELERQRFDVIFLDLVLLGSSGIDVLRAIKKRNHRTLVVVMAAHGYDPIALEAMSLGPLFLIGKPLSRSDIIEVLDTLIWPRL